MDGGAGLDVIIGDHDGNEFIINGAGSGELTDKIDSGFVNIENLTGGDGNDFFTFTNTGSLAGVVDGGAGLDEIRGDDDGNDFTVTATAEGELTDKISGGFSGTEFLIGGNGVDNFVVTENGVIAFLNGDGGNDNFQFEDGASVSSGVFGGDGVDTINADSGVTLTGFANEVTLTSFGSLNFGAFENVVSGSPQSVTGSDGNDTFEVTGPNEVSANGINFNNISDIDGAGGDDILNVSEFGNLTGTATGGPG